MTSRGQMLYPVLPQAESTLDSTKLTIVSMSKRKRFRLGNNGLMFVHHHHQHVQFSKFCKHRLCQTRTSTTFLFIFNFND